MNEALTGTGVALVTPFREDLSIDYDAYRRLLAFTAEGGVDFFVVQGTTGESVTTSAAEKQALLAFTLENNPQRKPVVFGVGGPDTAALQRTLRDTDLRGVAAVLSVSPYYSVPSQEGLYRHFTAVADASPAPIILYNVPSRTAVNLTAATTLRLAEHPNIIGIKEACPDVAQSLTIATNRPEGFLLLSGNDLMTLPMMSYGAEGVISVMANGFPTAFSAMVRAARAGDFTTARQRLHELLPADPLMYAESNPVGVKAALALRGIGNGLVRPPLVAASAALREALRPHVAQLA